MKDLILLAPEWLWLLALIPALWALALYKNDKSLKEVQQFRQAVISVPFKRETLSLSFVVLLLALALARPGWNPQPRGIQEQGRDIIFLLDVSRSMLAEDARPNRLEVARTAIRNTINSASDDRFGLAVFAGETAIQSPITRDRIFLNTVLDTVSPGSVPTGGTDIGNAMQAVLDTMIHEDSGAVDIVLITDGEDLGEEPEQAVVLLNELGARLLVIGLGDSQFGARVPARDDAGWTMDGDREHWSRLDEVYLRNLAEQADQGIYFPVGTAWLDLSGIIDQLSVLWPGKNREQGAVVNYTEGYQYLLLLAFLALADHIIRIWRIKPGAAAICILLLSFNIQAVELQEKEQESISELEKKAVLLLEQKRFDEAAVTYREVAQQADTVEMAVAANYNLATSLILLANSEFTVLPSSIKFLEAMGDGTEDYIDPEIYLDEAKDILRDILKADPDHAPSIRNLEWLAMEQYRLQEDIVDVDVEHEERGNEEEDRDDLNGQEESLDGDGEYDDDEYEDYEAGEVDDSAFDEMDPMYGDMLETTPSVSTRQILEEARQLENSLRELDQRRQNPVERDW